MPDLHLDTYGLRWDVPLPGTAPGNATSPELRAGGDYGIATEGVAGGQLLRDYGLRSAVHLSLMCDRAALDSDRLPEIELAGVRPNRRGYWADYLSPLGPEDRWGSRLWLLASETLTRATAARARTYALEALAWLETMAIARVAVDAWIAGPTVLRLRVDVTDAVTRESQQYSYLWQAMLERGV